MRSGLVNMASIKRADPSQLLQLQNVISTSKVIGRGSYGRVIEVYIHGTLCAAKEVHAKATPSHTLVSGHSQAYKWMRAGG